VIALACIGTYPCRYRCKSCKAMNQVEIWLRDKQRSAAGQKPMRSKLERAVADWYNLPGPILTSRAM